MNQAQRREYMLRVLLDENPRYQGMALPQDAEEQQRLLRSLMNIRPAKPINDDFLAIQDAYLQAEIIRKGITQAKDLPPIAHNLSLWQGDITTLQVDSIVNAANSAMLGCFVPCHDCIDNAIHTYAGVQLRMACDKLMQAQGYEEPTGQAKITDAYNLPSNYVLHTVGPIVYGQLTEKEEEQLASCYRSCLTLATEQELASIAFCCISTGEFHFPPGRAAEIAIQTVENYLLKHPTQMKVIFNVFKDSDLHIYRQLLGIDRPA